MTGNYAYFPHGAQFTQHAHEYLNPAKRRVFIAWLNLQTSLISPLPRVGVLGGARVKNLAMITLASFSIIGCHGVTTPSFPTLANYRAVATSEPQYLAAWADLDEASEYCRKIHNNYEARSKNAEEAKLGIGSAGGVLGVTGAMLAAAGTGGVAGGIASGLAGVASTVLGTAEKGPLGTAEFTAQKVSIAKMVQAASDDAIKLPVSDHAKIFAIGHGLRNSCFAAEASDKAT